MRRTGKRVNAKGKHEKGGTARKDSLEGPETDNIMRCFGGTRASLPSHHKEDRHDAAWTCTPSPDALLPARAGRRSAGGACAAHPENRRRHLLPRSARTAEPD